MDVQMEQDVLQVTNSTMKMAEGLIGDFLTLGNLLYGIKKKKQFRFAGFDTFKEYVECELKTTSSFANKLLNVHDMFVNKLEWAEDILKDLGFEKLAILLPIFKKNNMYQSEEFCDDWGTKASNMSITELKEEVKKYKESTKGFDAKSEAVDTAWEKAVDIFDMNKKKIIFGLASWWLLEKDAELKDFGKKLKVNIDKFERQLESDSGIKNEDSN